jgi:hypothetical protein
MATDSEGGTTSSGDELEVLRNLKPPSWNQRTAAQVIDIQGPGKINVKFI